VRAIIDTNGLLWHGTPHALLDHTRKGTITFLSSPALLAEFAEVIRRPKFHAILAQSKTDPEQLLRELRQLAEIIDPPPLPESVSRDRDDDVVLALAVAARADLIISGDTDLLVLGAYAGIQSSTRLQPSRESSRNKQFRITESRALCAFGR
jgi:putative PIN family toxin of toxin-antitoxin system